MIAVAVQTSGNSATKQQMTITNHNTTKQSHRQPRRREALDDNKELQIAFLQTQGKCADVRNCT